MQSLQIVWSFVMRSREWKFKLHRQSSKSPARPERERERGRERERERDRGCSLRVPLAPGKLYAAPVPLSLRSLRQIRKPRLKSNHAVSKLIVWCEGERERTHERPHTRSYARAFRVNTPRRRFPLRVPTIDSAPVSRNARTPPIYILSSRDIAATRVIRLACRTGASIIGH